MYKHLCLWFVGWFSWHPVPTDRKIRVRSYQLYSFREYHKPWKNTRKGNHCIIWRRIFIYKRANRRCRKGRTPQTRKRSRSPDCTNLTSTQIAHLLNIVLWSTYFLPWSQRFHFLSSVAPRCHGFAAHKSRVRGFATQKIKSLAPGYVFPVQWINLPTKGRSRYGEPCRRGYSQHLHVRFWGASDNKCDLQT